MNKGALAFTTDLNIGLDSMLRSSSSAWYGKYRHFTFKYADFIERNYDTIMSHVDLKMDPVIRLCEIKERNTFGMCYGDNKAPAVIYLDIRPSRNVNVKELLLSLCHELVHAEQWARGDIKTRGKNYFWKKTPMESALSLALNQELYESLPWETEAYGRQQTLYDKMLPSIVF